MQCRINGNNAKTAQLGENKVKPVYKQCENNAKASWKQHKIDAKQRQQQRSSNVKTTQNAAKSADNACETMFSMSGATDSTAERSGTLYTADQKRSGTPHITGPRQSILYTTTGQIRCPVHCKRSGTLYTQRVQGT